MFIIIWQYIVKKGREKEFESAYGPDGAWVRLFKDGAAYHGTELLRNAGVDRSYLTIDRWTSAEEYHRFLQERKAEYERIDGECAPLTESETRVGEYGDVI